MNIKTLILVGVTSITMTPVLLSEVTSQNNPRLKKALAQHPEADTNGDGILTYSEAKAFKEQMMGKNKGKGPNKSIKSYTTMPTHPDIKYGTFERNILDFWQADTKKKAPVFVYIHGGGFTSGSKEKANKTGMIEMCLENGYHFASINYRYKAKQLKDLDDPERTGLVGCFQDGVRAVQFLKHKSDELNIDKEKVIVFGSSAGGCITLFIGYYDDLADPSSSDPVLRESSRVMAIGHMYSQPTLNLDKWPEILGWGEKELKGIVDGVKAGVPEHIKLGFRNESDLKTDLGKKYLKMIDLTEHADPKDPPTFIFNPSRDEKPKHHGQIVHHPRLSKYLHKICQEQNIVSKFFHKTGRNVGASGYSEFLKWSKEQLQ